MRDGGVGRGGKGRGGERRGWEEAEEEQEEEGCSAIKIHVQIHSMQGGDFYRNLVLAFNYLKCIELKYKLEANAKLCDPSDISPVALWEI